MFHEQLKLFDRGIRICCMSHKSGTCSARMYIPFEKKNWKKKRHVLLCSHTRICSALTIKEMKEEFGVSFLDFHVSRKNRLEWGISGIAERRQKHATTDASLSPCRSDQRYEWARQAFHEEAYSERVEAERQRPLLSTAPSASSSALRSPVRTFQS